MMPTIKELVAGCYKTAVEHGWWEDLLGKPEGTMLDLVRRKDASMLAEKLCLIHSEVSEALEEVRTGQGLEMYYGPRSRVPTHNATKPEGFVVELADVCIRIFDLCGALGLDLEGAIEAKRAYNETRPYKHGGKVI